jgi:hypothetical protein
MAAGSDSLLRLLPSLYPPVASSRQPFSAHWASYQVAAGSDPLTSSSGASASSTANPSAIFASAPWVRWNPQLHQAGSWSWNRLPPLAGLDCPAQRLSRLKHNNKLLGTGTCSQLQCIQFITQAQGRPAIAWCGGCDDLAMHTAPPCYSTSSRARQPDVQGVDARVPHLLASRPLNNTEAVLQSTSHRQPANHYL